MEAFLRHGSKKHAGNRRPHAKSEEDQLFSYDLTHRTKIPPAPTTRPRMRGREVSWGRGTPLPGGDPEEAPRIVDAFDLAVDRTGGGVELPDLAVGSPDRIEPLAIGAQPDAVDRVAIEDF